MVSDRNPSQTRLGKIRIHQQAWVLKSWVARKPGWGLSRKLTGRHWDYTRTPPRTVSVSNSVSLSQSTRVIITKHHRCLIHRHLFPHSHGGQKLKPSVPAWLGSRESFLACRWPQLSLCAHMVLPGCMYVKPKRLLSRFFFLWGYYSHKEDPHLNLIISQKPCI